MKSLNKFSEPGKTVRGQEVERFLKRVAVEDSENLLKIGELGPTLGELILKEWFQAINRKLNNFQVCFGTNMKAFKR